MSNEIEVVIDKNITTTVNEYSPTEVLRQVSLIQEVMHRVMKDGEHYGVIPGCGNKPALLKSGAEKLALTFRLAPSYDVKIVDFANGHREYQVLTTIAGINNCKICGQGVGSCSTMENKYKYRWENTGETVPKEYWDSRDKSVLGGISFSARKTNSIWMIYQKIEHDNPADYYNTCLKMAKKRSFVDAILTVTSASDIFTQDVEDMQADNSQDIILGDNVKKEMAKKENNKMDKFIFDELNFKFDEFCELHKSKGTEEEKSEIKNQYKKWAMDQAQHAAPDLRNKLREFYKKIGDYNE